MSAIYHSGNYRFENGKFERMGKSTPPGGEDLYPGAHPVGQIVIAGIGVWEVAQDYKKRGFFVRCIGSDALPEVILVGCGAEIEALASLLAAGVGFSRFADEVSLPPTADEHALVASAGLRAAIQAYRDRAGASLTLARAAFGPCTCGHAHARTLEVCPEEGCACRGDPRWLRLFFSDAGVLQVQQQRVRMKFIRGFQAGASGDMSPEGGQREGEDFVAGVIAGRSAAAAALEAYCATQKIPFVFPPFAEVQPKEEGGS